MYTRYTCLPIYGARDVCVRLQSSRPQTPHETTSRSRGTCRTRLSVRTPETTATTDGNDRRLRGRSVDRSVDGFASASAAANKTVQYFRCTAVRCIITFCYASRLRTWPVDTEYYTEFSVVVLNRRRFLSRRWKENIVLPHINR